MKIIEDLFYGNIRPNERAYASQSKRMYYVHHSEKIRREFEKTLTDEQKTQFNAFLDANMKMMALDELEQFSYGFRIGMQLTVAGLHGKIRGTVDGMEEGA